MATLSNKDNLAYDFEHFEKVMTEENRAAKIRVHAKSAAKIGSPVKLLVMGAVVLCFLLLIVKSHSDIAALSDNIAKVQAEVNTLASEQVRMEAQIEGRSAIRYVEDYAENVLGMRKIDKSQIDYIDVTGGNQVVLPEAEKGLFTEMKESLDEFLEYLKG
jgi:cell division protein FtsL